MMFVCFFFKQRTAYELRIGDWSSDVCSSDLLAVYGDRGYDADWLHRELAGRGIADGIMRRNRPKHRLSADEVARNHALSRRRRAVEKLFGTLKRSYRLGRVPYFNRARNATALALACFAFNLRRWHAIATGRSEEHTSELQSLMRISY